MANRKGPDKIPAYNKRTLREHLLELFQHSPGKQFNYKQLAGLLSITNPETRKMINVVLDEMAEDDDIQQVSRGKFKYRPSESVLIGKVHLTGSGSAFISTDDNPEDIFIKRSDTNLALHGDKVRVKIKKANLGKNKKPEGEIIEIIERAKEHFVGIVKKSKNYAFLELTERNAPFDIFIINDNLNGAQEGDKAIARVLDFDSGKKNPEGVITEVLGRPEDNEVEMHAILAEFGLPYYYPEAPEKAAESINEKIPESAYKARKDFRNIPTFTIDPEDAKDFDDALSFRKLPNGNFEVGVHIADVSYYVDEGGIIDEEAYKRATSIYLPDRTIPMLPQRLSNFICSLRPDEEKLTYSAVFELNSKAEVKKEWFGRTIIKSDKRFSYEDAQEIIETGKGLFSEEINHLKMLAEALREQRFNHGSIAFERSEMRFVLDEDGKPLQLIMKEPKDAHKLIEEFMLLANKKVARFVAERHGGKYASSFVYRVHDEPDMEKLYNFSNFITRFGYNYKFKTFRQVPDKLNNLLREIRGSDMQNVIELLAVQSMSKAHYTTKNIGHFGLAFDFYTHFTSPIRRYPDLIVHRLLTRYLNNEKPADGNAVEAQCKHSSEAENLAVAAERASIKYKQVEFLKDKLGSDFDATIIGVSESGLFVRIDENQIEGMIPISEMDDDYYNYDDKKYCLTGRNSSKRYAIGDKVQVKLVKADLIRRRLDFIIA
jgi:ribonuclease R